MVRDLIGCKRRPRFRPDLGKRLHDIGPRRPMHLHASIAPRLNAALWLADPHVPNTQSGNKGNPVIHADRLTVITAQPAQGAVDAWRIEAPDLHSSCSQAMPEAR